MEQALQHFGIPGMKWGVRKKRQELMRTKKLSKQLSKDYVESRKIKAKSYKELSTAEIKKLNERLQVERTLNNLRPSTMNKGSDMVKTILAIGTTVSTAYALSQSPLGQSIKKALIKG